MTAFRYKVTLLYIVLGLLVGLAVQGMIVSSLIHAPASFILPPNNYTIATNPGALVKLEFTSDKNRECITQTTRWLWRDVEDKREIIELTYSAMAFGHDTPGTKKNYRFIFEIPHALPIGSWNLRTLHADYCWPWSWVLGPRIRTSPAFGLVVTP